MKPLVGMLVLGLMAGCQPTSREPAPDWVADAAEVLSAAEESDLVDMILALNDETAVEMTCVIVHGTGEVSINTYADRLLWRWEVGLDGVFNGIVIVIDTKNRLVRLSRGDGMRWVISDDDVDAILDAMTKHLAEDHYFLGLHSGIEEVANRVRGITWEVAYFGLPSLPSEGAEGQIVSFAGMVQRVSGDTVFVMDADSVHARLLLLPGTAPEVMEEEWEVHARVYHHDPLVLQLLGLEAGPVVGDLF